MVCPEETKDVATLSILEQFTSLQGEGVFAGSCVHFVRLAGCNLECSWCDTAETMLQDVQYVYPGTLAKRLLKLKTRRVVFTGGEPTLHLKQIERTIVWSRYLETRFKLDPLVFMLETNGTNPTPKGLDWVTCSPKPAAAYRVHEHCRVDEIKLVVDRLFKIELALEFLERYPECAVSLQPESGIESTKQCIDYILEYPQLRLSVQLHKILGIS